MFKLHLGLKGKDYKSAKDVLERFISPLPELELNLNKKPFFKGSSLQFNLSHSQDIYLLLLSDECPVGVDLEEIKNRRFCAKLAQRFFTAKEQDFLEKSEDYLKAFYALWTRREALVKCLGIGLWQMREQGGKGHNFLSFSFEFNGSLFMATLCCKKPLDMDFARQELGMKLCEFVVDLA